jgi:ADP-ribose pyrophosphatase YjhB (NUDIX family)
MSAPAGGIDLGESGIAPEGIELRCSAVVFRAQAVLLVHRVIDGCDDWVLPGGTPRYGETMAACARREVLEETGLSAEPTRIALVLEAIGPAAGQHTVDLVFAAREYGPPGPPEPREPGLRPAFIHVADLSALNLRPGIAGHLRNAWANRLRSAPYLGNMWRPTAAAAARASRAQR